MSIKTKKILIVVLTVVILLLSGGIFAMNSYLNKMLSNVEQGEDIAEEEVTHYESGNVVNFALFGVDMEGGTSQYDELRSDALKIVSLDYDNKTVKITSLSRYMMVYYPEEDNFIHLNWAYWYGGAGNAAKTINMNFDLDIRKYVAISFGAFTKIIDEVGGVDIELDEEEAQKVFSNRYKKAGSYHLNSKQALNYARLRSTDSDFNRMDRQNKVIKAIVAACKDMSVTDLMGMVSDVLPYVTTNLWTEEIKKYLLDLPSFDLNNIETYTEPSGLFGDFAVMTDDTGYVVNDFSGMVLHLHRNIYGESDYLVSEEVLNIEKKMYEVFDYHAE